MTEAVLQLKNVSVQVQQSGSVKTILQDIDLVIQPRDFVSVVGTNGAGKSTLFNVIAGNLTPSSGQIYLLGRDITHQSPEKRAQAIARVFQDPKLGTAPRMTVSENLLLAQRRGLRRGLKNRQLKAQMAEFKKITEQIGNGLETRLMTPAGDLSGGQRQVLSLLMATILPPELLLLDEHTAALDPKTSQQLLELTQQQIDRHHLTCLMITHHMEDALKYGNRIIVLNNGVITQDISGVAKAALTQPELLQYFAATH